MTADRMRIAKQQMQPESSALGLPDSDRGGTLEGMVVIELTEALVPLADY